MKKKMKLYPLYAISVFAVAVPAAFMRLDGLLFVLLLAVAFIMESLLLRYARPEVLIRSLPLEHWWDRLLPPMMVVFAAATAVLSALDALVWKASVIISFITLVGGVVLLMSAMLIMIQSLRAQPPHGEEKYGEAPKEGLERGPYEVVRHPMMLAVILGGLSIPLFLGSGIGFIPAALLVATVIARTAAEDEWRFNNYEWFYDYTKEVSYRLIPFIW